MTSLMAVVLLLAGCDSVPGLDSVTGLFSPSSDASGGGAAQPSGAAQIRFRVGDRYTFDNPVERWEVVEIRGDRVYWRSDTGERRVTGFNPLLPPQEWQSRTKGSGRRFIRDIEGSLLPIRVGATMTFRATATSDRPPFGWEHVWTCRVTDRKKIEALSGSFDTFVVICGHERPNVLTYYYAPQVGNFVRSEARRPDGQPDRVRTLLSFERSDGTVVAGIVGRAPDAAPVPPVQQAEAVTAQPSRKQAGARAEAVSPTVSEDRVVTARPVNPPLELPENGAVQNALTSVVLTEPIFGGRRTPLPPLPQEPEQSVPDNSYSNAAPPPTPAPLVPVRKAVPVAPPPVRKAQPRRPEARPVQAASAETKPDTPVPSLFGPRVGSEAAQAARRPRVPVPPPAAARIPVPPPPAVSMPIPAPPKPVAVAPTVPPPTKVDSGRSAVPPPPPKASVASTVVIHLASFRNEAAARKGWTELHDANSDLLDGLQPSVRRVEIEGKGTYYRLYAGPVQSSAVDGLCRKLNSRGVFCTPSG